MSFFGFGQTADIEIVFDDADKRKVAEIKTDDGKKEKYLLYYDGETVSGKVNVTLRKPGSKLEHQGIKVELIGQIELFYDRGNHHEFISLVKELARPGDLLQHTSYPFEFANVEKPFEVYTGSNVRLRYFLRATIVRRLTDVVKEVDIAVHTLCSYPDVLNSIKMEVGIEDCLHIEFEYNKSKYHLKDVIVGKIYFLLVRIKIKHMEISIIKRETTGSGPNTFTENETVAKYEIMDGAPVRGESIPIRVFLAGYDLTPTMRDINNKFSVRYYLNLVLMDTEDRRYFKQQEVTLWRKSDKSRLPLTHNPHNPQHLVSGERQPPRQQSASSDDLSVSQNPLSNNRYLEKENMEEGPENGYDVQRHETPIRNDSSTTKATEVAETLSENAPILSDIANNHEEAPKVLNSTDVAAKVVEQPKTPEPILKAAENTPKTPEKTAKIDVAPKPTENAPDKSDVAQKPESSTEELTKKLSNTQIENDSVKSKKPPIAEKPTLKAEPLEAQ